MKIYGGLPKSKTMKAFIARESYRVTSISFEGSDGIFIYTDTSLWCDDAGAGTFQGNTETQAVKNFYERVMKADQQGDTK